MTTSSTYPQSGPDQTKSSAIKAGWICYGIGVVLTPFIIGIYFFPIAIICAVVGLCTHDVKRGIILLATMIGTLIIGALLFLVGVIGTVGIVANTAMENSVRSETRSVYSTPSSQILRTLPKPPEFPRVSTPTRSLATNPRVNQTAQVSRTARVSLAGLSREDRIFTQIKLQGISGRNGEFRAAINGTGFYLRETRLLRFGNDEATLTCTAIDHKSVTLRIVNTQFSRSFEL